MYNTNSNPALTHITFSGSTTDAFGGGMSDIDSNPVLTDVTFDGNVTEFNGGGLYSAPGLTNLALTNITFSDNVANYGGGLINFCDSGKSGKSSTDTFGIRIVYTPVAPQPGALPNSTPQLLKGGDIKLS